MVRLIIPIHQGLGNQVTIGSRECSWIWWVREEDQCGDWCHKRRRWRTVLQGEVCHCNSCSEGKVARDRVSLRFLLREVASGVGDSLPSLADTMRGLPLCEAESSTDLSDLLAFRTPLLGFRFTVLLQCLLPRFFFFFPRRWRCSVLILSPKIK